MWVKLSQLLNSAMQSKGISWITFHILKVLGLAGGFWNWIVALAIKYGWKKADKEIQSQARLADRTKSDKEIREEYMDKIKTRANEEELIKSEESILNSGRTRKR